MDEDQMQQDPNDDELTRRLEAYASARLSPDLEATTRMRARVMAAAHHQVALGRADRTHVSRWRRPMTALLAAGLTLAVGVGSVAAAQPGGPIYGARIWAETLTLPANANERAQAQLRRLTERLAEAAAATAAGDTNAANAALDAYEAIVEEATVGVGESVSAAASLNAGVRSNIDVLTVLASRLPLQARDAIQHAIDRSGSALDEMHGQPAGNPPAATPAKPDTMNHPEPGANPNKPGAAPAGPAAKPNQKPTPTPKPSPTPKPDHAPAGGPPIVPPANDGAGSQGN